MASSAPFDVHKLFRPPTPMPGPTSSGPNPSNPVGGGGGGGGFPQPSPSSSPYSVPLQTPPLHGAYSYPPATPPFHHPAFLHYPQDTLHRSPISYPSPPPPHLPNPSSGPGPSPNSNPNPGARLMALLGTTASPSHLDTAISMPRPSSMPQEFSMAPPIVHAPPSAPPQQPSGVPMAAVSRAPSGKAPRGRHLGPGERVSYDVDSRLPGEAQPPQLEVTPITKYASDPGLVLGRQIAVNRTYICYGLKLGAIRVLNINTALRSLLRGHNQRVTDMAFFAEDVHILASASVDGRVFVWKIDEGPNEEDKPQITGRIVIAIQIIGDGESYHPRVCWHSHKQEILMVGIGNRVLKIDTTKVGRGKEFSAEEPLRCPLDKLIDGMQFIGKHDAEVTDLSISQWMITRLASASKDGTVKIWDDRKAMPLVTLRPHDGQPVNSVAFLTAPNRPEHIVLVTAGPLNREVKIWVSAGEEGWLLPSESESWHCTQTLDLRSSAEPRQEEAFFNQVVVLPRASLILLANAKKNAIYAVHVDYGLFPASTHMDYIADFTVAMPILSLTGTSDCFSDGEQVVQVYCVQTQAIQQYALDLSLCLPPPVDTSGLGKDTGSSQVSDAHSSEEISQPESSIVHAMNDLPVGSASLNTFHLMSSSDNSLPSVPEGIRMQELASSNAEAKPSAPPLASADTDTAHSSSFAAPLTLDPLGGLSTLRSPGKGFERGPVFCDRNVDQSVLDYTVDRRVDAGIANVANAPSIEENSGKHEFKLGPNDVSALPNPSAMIKLGGNTTHLITPFEILSGALSSESSLVDHTMKGEEVKVQDMVINNDLENVEVEIKVVGESGVGQHEDFDCRKEPQALPTENMDSSQTLETNGETAKECSSLTAENYTIVEARRIDDVAIMEALESSPSTAEDQVQDGTKDVSEKATEASASTVTQFISTTKGKKQKVIQSQGSGSLSPSPSPFNSTDSLNETGSSAGAPSLDAALSQILTMQEALNQLMIMQKEMQKQISVMVAVPLNKEGRRMEAALGRIMEKAVKANVDALWARLQEENAKHEKIERDRVQHLTNLITNSMSKDFPAMLERALKKEFLALGPNLARAITPVVEKAISSAIADSFQRGIGDKAMNQLEKSINSKLEGTVARQIQAQFQTSGKQALQDALRSTLESSVIPAFEMSCKVMFEQVDAAFQKGMSEHTTAAQQQVESAYTPLALTLRDAINSASSITQNISSELADGQRKLLALVAAGNTKALNPLALQQNNGPMGSHLDMTLSVQQVEASLDPTKELTRLISEHKFGEAFTLALHRSNVSIVSWLCSQVDLQAILSTLPSPLSQGVLLSLLQQLACDISNDTTRKLDWMTTVASAIIPGDPSISVHVRRIIDQVSVMLGQQRSLPTTTPMEGMKIRLLMHVLTSILANCK